MSNRPGGWEEPEELLDISYSVPPPISREDLGDSYCSLGMVQSDREECGSPNDSLSGVGSGEILGLMNYLNQMDQLKGTPRNVHLYSGPLNNEEMTDNTKTADYLTGALSEPHSSSSVRTSSISRVNPGGNDSAVRLGMPSNKLTLSGYQYMLHSFSMMGSHVPQGAYPASRCDAGLLRRIILFLPYDDRRDIIEMGSVCRLWHMQVKHAPHWSIFRQQDHRTRSLNLPKKLRTSLSQQQTVNRDEYISERQILHEYKEKGNWKSRVGHWRWCVAIAITVGVLIILNFGLAFFLAYATYDLLDPEEIAFGAVAFSLMLVNSVLEGILVVTPLSRNHPELDTQPDDDQHTSSTARELASPAFSSLHQMGSLSFALSWWELLVVVSIVFGTIIALAFSRIFVLVKANQSTIATDGAEFLNCSFAPWNGSYFIVFPTKNFSSTTHLPSVQREMLPYCTASGCYALVFRGLAYLSESAPANFFSSCKIHLPDSERNDASVLLCTGQGGPGFTDESSGSQPWWLRREGHNGHIEYRSSFRETVPFSQFVSALKSPSAPSPFFQPQDGRQGEMYEEKAHRFFFEADFGSNFSAHHHWVGEHVRLEPREGPLRNSRNDTIQHFKSLVSACIGITGSLWIVMLISQAISIPSGTQFLGVTTCITLLCLNPLTMLLSGVLCITQKDDYFMCSSSSGGMLIGMSFCLLSFALAAFLWIREVS